MQNYKIANIDDRQIVQDLDTGLYYLTLETYSKMAETTNLNVEKKAEKG